MAEFILGAGVLFFGVVLGYSLAKSSFMAIINSGDENDTKPYPRT